MPTEAETLWTYYHAADAYRRALETSQDIGLFSENFRTTKLAYIEADFAVRDLEKTKDDQGDGPSTTWWAFTDSKNRKVRFTHDPYIQKSECRCYVDGTLTNIISCERARDGGTTVIHTHAGTFTKPSPLKMKKLEVGTRTGRMSCKEPNLSNVS